MSAEDAALGAEVRRLLDAGATYITLSDGGEHAIATAARYLPNPDHNPDDETSPALLTEWTDWGHTESSLLAALRSIQVPGGGDRNREHGAVPTPVGGAEPDDTDWSTDDAEVEQFIKDHL